VGTGWWAQVGGHRLVGTGWWAQVGGYICAVEKMDDFFGSWVLHN